MKDKYLIKRPDGSTYAHSYTFGEIGHDLKKRLITEDHTAQKHGEDKEVSVGALFGLSRGQSQSEARTPGEAFEIARASIQQPPKKNSIKDSLAGIAFLSVLAIGAGFLSGLKTGNYRRGLLMGFVGMASMLIIGYVGFGGGLWLSKRTWGNRLVQIIVVIMGWIVGAIVLYVMFQFARAH